MTGLGFCRYDLRTTDPDAARRFYTDVVGLDLGAAATPDAPSPLAVWPLHEQARARDAPAHWLGHIGVADVEVTAGRLLERGGQRLGPTLRAADGTPFAMLRDPFGAVLAVRQSLEGPRGAPVAWHHLHTTDLDRAWGLYAELFGCAAPGTLDVAGHVGGHRMFAFPSSGKSVGSMSDTALQAGVHPHWLFFFAVADLEGTAARVQASGGQVLGSPATLPGGARLVPCEDPQGAAFGLHQSR